MSSVCDMRPVVLKNISHSLTIRGPLFIDFECCGNDIKQHGDFLRLSVSAPCKNINILEKTVSNTYLYSLRQSHSARLTQANCKPQNNCSI